MWQLATDPEGGALDGSAVDPPLRGRAVTPPIWVGERERERVNEIPAG